MDERIKRLHYRAWHRGTKELDLLLGPFADSALATMDDAALHFFEQLMEQPEPLLHAWITGQEPPPFQHPVMTQLIAFHQRSRV